MAMTMLEKKINLYYTYDYKIFIIIFIYKSKLWEWIDSWLFRIWAWIEPDDPIGFDIETKKKKMNSLLLKMLLKV